MDYILAPSILSADFLTLKDQIDQVEKAGAKYLHFDVMDGMFVRNISFGIPVLKCLKGNTGMVLDVHLMIMEPARYFEKFKDAGAQILTIHYEATRNVKEDLLRIKELGMIPSLTISPDTDAEVVFPYLDYVNQILIMTVQPGEGAQAYIDKCTEKIHKVRVEIDKRGLDVNIQVDGGINEKTILTAKDAGANVFVMGSSIFHGDPYENTIKYKDILGIDKKTIVNV
jgi:ribulose-phosphate 3-epimerase